MPPRPQAALVLIAVSVAFVSLAQGCGKGPEPRLPPPRPSSTVERADGPATRSICEPGRGDCDGNLKNGCEADLTRSSEDCGVCGKRCSGDCLAGFCSDEPLPHAEPMP